MTRLLSVILLLLFGLILAPADLAKPAAPAKRVDRPALPKKTALPSEVPIPKSVTGANLAVKGKVLPKGSPEFLWRIKSPTATVYLIGTFHVLKPDFYPLPVEMEKAFAASKNLVLEVDLSKQDPAALQALVISRARYPQGDSIKNHISESTYELLKTYLEALRQSPENPQFAQNKPWFMYLQVTMTELAKRGFDPKVGIDRHFAAEAQIQGKKMIGLETDEFQIKLLSGFDEALQDKLLQLTLLEMQDFEKDLKEIMDAWWRGDTKLMDEVISRDVKEHPELLPVSEKMYDERNYRMADKIDDFLKAGGSYFVAVGSGHIVGEKGLVSLLTRKGYTVEQITAGTSI